MVLTFYNMTQQHYKSSLFHHHINSCLFSIFPKVGHPVDWTWNPHDKASKTAEDYHFTAFFFQFKDCPVHDVLIAIFVGGLGQIFMGVHIFDVAAVDHPYQEGVLDVYGIEEDVDVNFNWAAVLLIWEGGQVNSWNVPERGSVVRVDPVNSESVFEKLFVHQLITSKNTIINSSQFIDHGIWLVWLINL